MGIGDLRKEFLKLQKEFLGGPVGKLKAHEVEHRMAALKAAMAAKTDIPEPAPKRAGPPKAREVKTKTVALDDETEVTKPVAPEGGKVHATSYKKKVKTEEAAPVEKPAPKPRKVAVPKVETEAAPAAPAEKPKKPRRIPPKVVLKEDETPKPSLVVEEAAKPKPKPKSKATGAPKITAPEPEIEAPAPVVEKPVKLPGGCRALPASELYLN